MEPWSSIKPPLSGNGYKATLSDPEHQYDFYWARNINGQYVFRFMGEFNSEVGENAPTMRGIEVTCGEENNRTHLTLVLASQEDGEIFQHLCNSLMEATNNLDTKNDSAAIGIILTHLGRWQKLLRDRGSGLLSPEKQLGLFGELLVLRDIYLANLNFADALESWTGPMGDEQDFGYGQSLVEVKTTRSTRDQEIKIASVDQLDSISGDISLIVQTLGIFEDNPPQSLSLNALVSNIQSILEDSAPSLVDQFGMRLALVGYEVHPEYEKKHYTALSRRFFEVDGDFPRICASELRTGVLKTSYSISMDSCLPFELNSEMALDRILQGVTDAELDEINTPIELLIKLDESAKLEFKSTLRICLKTNKPEKYIEHSILKTVAAFANTSGGKLVIGVSDKNTILGLQNDFQSLKQNDSDGFVQCLVTMLVNNFGEVFATNSVKIENHQIDGKYICIATVSRSSDLLFLEQVNGSGKKSNSLYVRIGNSTRETPPETIQKYIESRS